MKDCSTTARLGRVEYIRFKVHPEEEPRFLQDYRLAAARLEACDACLAYELCRSDEPVVLEETRLLFGVYFESYVFYAPEVRGGGTVFHQIASQSHASA